MRLRGKENRPQTASATLPTGTDLLGRRRVIEPATTYAHSRQGPLASLPVMDQEATASSGGNAPSRPTTGDGARARTDLYKHAPDSEIGMGNQPALPSNSSNKDLLASSGMFGTAGARARAEA